METRLFLMTAMVLVAGGCIGLLVVRISNPFLKGLGWLSATFACGAVSTLLLYFDGHIPRFYTNVLANGLTLLAYMLLHAAILDLEQRSGRRVTIFSLVVFALWLASALIYTYARDSHQMRVVYGSILIALQALQSVVVLLRHPEKGIRVPVWYTAIVLFGFALFNLVRAVLIAINGMPEDIFAPSRLQLLSVLVYLSTALGVGFGFFWMSTAKLRFTLERLASTDPLTGVSNRRVFLAACERELARCQRSGETFSLLVADIDHFKRINDRFGHMAGDTVLCAIADCIQAQLRTSDILGRWGGEEFVVLLPDCPPNAALEVADRLREGVEHFTPPNLDVHVTVSLGVATFRGAPDPLDDVLRRGDQALYQAKAAGRNRVLALP
jgi:diguanylate cyclase (GGDEF)-like protein